MSDKLKDKVFQLVAGKPNDTIIELDNRQAELREVMIFIDKSLEGARLNQSGNLSPSINKKIMERIRSLYQ